MRLRILILSIFILLGVELNAQLSGTVTVCASGDYALLSDVSSDLETVLSEESPIVVIRQHNLQTCLHNFSHKDLKFQPQPMFFLPQM